LHAMSSTDFTLLLEANLTPEGLAITLPLIDNMFELAGRVHFNEGPTLWLNSLRMPRFTGRSTVSNPDLSWLSQEELSWFFQGGLSYGYPKVNIARPEDIDVLRAACSSDHVWAAELQGQPLTTLLRFDMQNYMVAQYFTELCTPQDTIFHLPWTVQPLPQLPAAEPLIWVQGVARLKGVVEGELTVLVSDSLFLMGDLIVADAILAPCYDQQLFGTVPAESVHRIGLIGEKDVIIASTLENGFADGENIPLNDCGMTFEPVLTSCNQYRRDIMITASILALGCAFQSEYWFNTAWQSSVPGETDQVAGCTGSNFSHVVIWDQSDCPGGSPYTDARGTIWLHGSIAARTLGILLHSYTSGQWPLGMLIRIGYGRVVFRPDPRLVETAPPWWPRLEWLFVGEEGYSLPPPLVEPFNGTQSTCGAIVDPDGFWHDWVHGGVGLRIQRFGDIHSFEVRCRLQAGDSVLADTTFSPDPTGSVWVPSVDPRPALMTGERVWVSASSEVFVADYNLDGEHCAWWLSTAVDPTPARPAKLALGLPYPNPFNPTTRVSLTLPAPEGVRLALVDLLGREARVLHEGLLPAGDHELAVEAAGLPSGLWLLRLERAGGAVEARKLLLLR
jgi:hypothetical protein